MDDIQLYNDSVWIFQRAVPPVFVLARSSWWNSVSLVQQMAVCTHRAPWISSHYKSHWGTSRAASVWHSLKHCVLLTNANPCFETFISLSNLIKTLNYFSEVLFVVLWCNTWWFCSDFYVSRLLMSKQSHFLCLTVLMCLCVCTCRVLSANWMSSSAGWETL